MKSTSRGIQKNLTVRKQKKLICWTQQMRLNKAEFDSVCSTVIIVIISPLFTFRSFPMGWYTMRTRLGVVSKTGY